MKPVVTAAWREARKALDSDSRGHLQWPARISLWRAMNVEYGEESLIRRACLSLTVAADLIPLWFATCGNVCDSDAPSKLLALGRRFLLRMVDDQDAMREFDELSFCADAAAGHAHCAGTIYAVPLTAKLACLDALRAFSPEYLEDEIWYDVERGIHAEHPQSLDSEDYECHLYACEVQSGVWLADSSGVEARRRYWEHWLGGQFLRANTEPIPTLLAG